VPGEGPPSAAACFAVPRRRGAFMMHSEGRCQQRGPLPTMVNPLTAANRLAQPRNTRKQCSVI
jgi:hypothetical protein